MKIDQLFRSLERGLLLLVGRGRVTAFDDAGDVQTLQVQLGENEVRDNTYRLAEFGFASVPPDASDVVVLFVGGDRSNGVVIASGSQRYRMRGLKKGEAALHDAFGKHVYLAEDRIEIDANNQDVVVNNARSLTVNGPTTFNGDVAVNGKISATGHATFGDGVEVSGAVEASGEGTFNGIDVSTHSHKFVAQAGNTPLTTQGPQG